LHNSNQATMKLNFVMIFAFVALLLGSGCQSENEQGSYKGEDPKTEENKEQPKEETPVVDPGDVKPTTSKIKAKFLSFEMGDAAYFIFEDEAGNPIEFAENKSEAFQFAMGLPEKEANETNQGWTSNPDLVGNWFEIDYSEEIRPLYIDGPEGTVNIIQTVQALD